MYKLRIWEGPGRDYFVTIVTPADRFWHRQWKTVPTIEEASELTIEWIQKNIGEIYDIIDPEMVQILQVREHSK